MVSQGTSASQMSTENTIQQRGNSLGGLYWILIKISSLKGVVKHWHRLPRAMLESPSLEGFKCLVDVAFGDII